MKKQLIIFTDLDGTLLDHDTYSFAKAQSALDRLKVNQVPLVLTTSKAYAEVKEFQAKLAISDPCIIENGSAIYAGTSAFSQSLDLGEAKIFGRPYDEICTFIDQLPKNIRRHIRGFGDMSVKGVCEITDLPIDKAEKAKDRLASEPFLWTGTDAELKELESLLKAENMALLQGGRFYHILSKTDKSEAINWMMARLKSLFPANDYHSCALGDGPNDAKMIAAAETGIVIANPEGVALSIEAPFGKIKYPEPIGPQGWAVGMHELMDELGLD
ncbi:HAD-IIB family hydrolase [Terasakiella sp. A23]|uniref:HAD-IIB family hydrolase n=1 Tax=Terasakiella sp. FCG-A23 TaxID=3080561 RepID=UPI0029550D14|nr:HAD-IIB family hydrolase [Terasakiella sp. A23]MDV7338628.1 HAD-IIB family hydrolase [Terasakiella sp. A23]